MFKTKRFIYTLETKTPDGIKFQDKHELLMDSDLEYYFRLVNDLNFGMYEAFTRVTGKSVENIVDLKLEVIHFLKG